MSSVLPWCVALFASCASSSPNTALGEAEVAALARQPESEQGEIRPWIPGQSTDDKPLFSKFGDQVLSRASVIVKGSVVSVAGAPPRADVVRVEVSFTFKGEEQTEVILLAHRGEFFAGSELLLFLTPFEDGPRYTCFNHISTSDPDYAAKEEHLSRQVGLNEEPDEDRRREMARATLLETAASEVLWTRRNMLRELEYVLRRYPDMIRDEDDEELRKIASASTDATFAKELVGLLEKRGEGSN